MNYTLNKTWQSRSLINLKLLNYHIQFFLVGMRQTFLCRDCHDNDRDNNDIKTKNKSNEKCSL